MSVPTVEPTPAHLGLILHHMLVDIRNLSYDGETREIYDLADLAELIPLQFVNWHPGYLAIITGGLKELAGKYPRASRYAAVLDMTAEQVAAELCPTYPDDWGSDIGRPAETAS
jgi:hypothetical protein